MKSDYRTLLATSFTFLFLMATTLTGLAQDAAAGGDAAAAADTQPQTFIDIFLGMGFVGWMLLVLSIVMFTFTIEGFVKFRQAKLAPPAVIALLRDAFTAGDYQQAWQVCRSNPCFVSTVVGEGLVRIGKGRDMFENTMADVSAKESMKAKANLAYLSVVGVVAPMFGLLGTVQGMIEAFNVLAAQGASNFSALAAAIGLALWTTLAGLVVGIPAFILYYVLRNIAASALSLADTRALELVEDLPLEQLVGVYVGAGAETGYAEASASGEVPVAE